jgi:ABC-type nitrate/sulfonate/bicarbonate transport system substrate-binding protein
MRRHIIAILAFSGLALGAPMSAPAQQGTFATRRDMASDAGGDPKRVNIIYAEGTGSFVVLLEIAKAQALFGKRDIEVRTLPTRGAAVPRLTDEAPLGLIGAPAALLQVADGVDLKLIATLSTTNLSGHLVAQPGIKASDDLRGKRLGVRVIGAGIWISTILALEQLQLDANRDGITMVPVGSPAEIFRALVQGAIDGALVTPAQSRELEAKGFSVLLRDYPTGITSFDGVLAARTDYAAAHAEVIEAITAALIEALAFGLNSKNHSEVMKAFEVSLRITDPGTASDNLRELWWKPYPLLHTLQRMQRIIGTHDARVLDIPLESLIDDRFVRALDQTGTIDALYRTHGASMNPGQPKIDVAH